MPENKIDSLFDMLSIETIHKTSPFKGQFHRSVNKEIRPKDWVTNADPAQLTALPDGRGYLQHNPIIELEIEYRDVKLGVPQPGYSDQEKIGASQKYLEEIGHVGLYKIEP